MSRRWCIALAKPGRQVPTWCLLFLLAGSGSISIAQATEITELTPLNFGTLAITSNESVSTLEFPRSGRNLVITGNLILVERGTPGRYQLTGFPPNTGIDVDINQATLTAGGTGIAEPITADNYDVGAVLTNELGEAEFALGASFSTSGNDGGYEDAPYRGGAQMRLHFWEPSVGDYVTVSKNIDFFGAVRSSFALDEGTSMNFGTLFARGEPGKQASLRLYPDGRLNITNTGEAKILSLSPPRPAALVVSGAAPNRKLAIDAEQPAIEMRHKNNPTGPHFILTNFETSPDGSSRTDDAGELEISVGATLKTQGDFLKMVVYPAGTYEATYTITVSY